jgi:hypothetical protein
VPTVLADTGHVPSVRRAPQARNSPTQQVYRNCPFRNANIHGHFQPLLLVTARPSAHSKNLSETKLTFNNVSDIIKRGIERDTCS